MDPSLPAKLESPNPDDDGPDVQVIQLDDGRLVAFVAASTGPIPSAEELAAYNDVVPGSAGQIIDEFLREGQASRDRDGKLVDAHIASRGRAQWMAVGLALSFVAVAALAVDRGQPWIAAMFGAIGVAGVILGILKEGGIALPERGTAKSAD
jgi:hypothetical protein